MAYIVKAVFGSESIVKTDTIYQYNSGQVLQVEGLAFTNSTEFHLAIHGKDTASIITGTIANNIAKITIPEVLMINDFCTCNYRIDVFVYVIDNDSGYTKYKIIIPVKSRPRPKDYYVDLPTVPELKSLKQELNTAVNNFNDAYTEIDQLKSETASLKEDVEKLSQSKISKFYASNQSETHITDSDNGKIQDMMLYGKSSQDGTPSPENPVEIKSVVNPTVKVTNEDGLKVQSVTLNNITLNAIPVSSGGNVTIDGKQYIADYVDVERGKYVQMIQTDKVQSNITWIIQKQQKGYSLGYASLYKNGISTRESGMRKTWKSNMGDSSDTWSNGFSFGLSNVFWIVPYENDGNITSDDINAWLVEHPMDIMYPLTKPIETDLTSEENEAFKALVTNYPVTNISVTSDQLDGYTVFNYPISMANGWNYVKQQLNDNRDYIYDMDLQSAEAYVNSEYAVALTELEV